MSRLWAVEVTLPNGGTYLASKTPGDKDTFVHPDIRKATDIVKGVEETGMDDSGLGLNPIKSARVVEVQIMEVEG